MPVGLRMECMAASMALWKLSAALYAVCVRPLDRVSERGAGPPKRNRGLYVYTVNTFIVSTSCQYIHRVLHQVQSSCFKKAPCSTSRHARWGKMARDGNAKPFCF